MSYDPDNIFARIIRGELPAKKVYEDEDVLAFHDIHPSAPIHVLVLPKQQYVSFDDFAAKAKPEIVANFFKKVQAIAKKLGVHKTGYRLISNHGSDAMQTVPHFHMHLLGQRLMGPLVSGDTYHR